MSYRPHCPPQPLLIGYDPLWALPPDHLARLVEYVVEETLGRSRRAPQRGQPPYDPRLCLKVLIYGYATGVRSSRALERHCRESLPFLFLTRGDTPSYHTLCTARTREGDALEAVWEGLFQIAAEVGLSRLGRITVDSSRFRADASAEAVLKQEEYAAVRAELERILAEAAVADAAEANAEEPGRTTLGQTVPPEQMRDILRRVRQQRRAAQRREAARAQKADAEPPVPPEGPPPGGTPPGRAAGGGTLPLEDLPPPTEPAPARPMSQRMLDRVRAGLQALQEAEADGRKHLCLTDPDARMMVSGSRHTVQECHSFEVAVDQGLLVAGGTTQEYGDSGRLEPLVAAAARHEPEGVQAVTADSGYYAGDAVGRLLEQGLDLCVPDPNTAADLRRREPIGSSRARGWGRGREEVPLTYDGEQDAYTCPEGNTLVRVQQRRQAGQALTVYQATADCRECPRAAACLARPTSQRRTLQVGVHHAALEAARQRFREREHRERYAHRGEQVETVFGFLRGALGFGRWQLRGAAKVACEGKLFKLAYQLRKLHLTGA